MIYKEVQALYQAIFEYCLGAHAVNPTEQDTFTRITGNITLLFYYNKAHMRTPSSDPSRQSSAPSMYQVSGTQRPFIQLNASVLHGG